MAKKIKILHIIPRFEVGGAEMLVWHYARLMNGTDFEIAVASCVEDGPFRAEFEKLGVRVWAGSRVRMGGRLGVWRELKKFTDGWQPEIVHTHLMAGDFFGYLLKRRSAGKIRWISTQHNVEFHTSWPRRLLWRIILPHADRVIAVAKKVRQYTMNNFGVQEEKIITVRNGVDLKNWIAISSAGLFRGDKLRLATIGRLEEQKGHIYLVRALAELKEINWSWDVFGDGSLSKLLESEAQRLGIADRIVWHGVVSAVYQKLDDIDVVIQPSLWEGLCIVVMEAMAAGKCVLASVPAGEELIDGGRTGMLVAEGDARALKDALQYLYSYPEIGRDMGARARETAREKFDIKNNVEEIKGLYKFLDGQNL